MPITWGITTFFNSANSKNKLINYFEFRKGTQRQGLCLMTIELAMRGAPFQLQGNDADILIQVRSNSVLWHKERLLNIALRHLPSEMQNLIWLDADIIFENEKWLFETEEKLKIFPVVQPFSHCVRLLPNLKSANIKLLSHGNQEMQVQDSAGYNCFKRKNIYGHTGYAWAVRRGVFEGLGFYDKLILGSGDNVIGDAFCARETHSRSKVHDLLPENLREDISQWTRQIQEKVAFNVGCVLGTVFHLFHGHRKDRYYHSRLEKLQMFEPKHHLKLNQDDCWEWTETAPEDLVSWAKGYFELRKEDSI